MNTITANDLKVKGIAAISKAVSKNTEAFISIRGKPQYIVMPIEQYNHLRECELEAALKESQKDLKNKKFSIKTVEEHIKKISHA